MFSLFSLSRFGREVQSGRGKRQPCRPRLEVLEDRNVLAFWTTVSPMGTARKLLAGTLGSNGLIYAIGGADTAFTPLATVEAYTTGSDFWSPRASLNTARFDVAAASGPDGRIYAIGGNTGAGTTPTVESYSPTVNKWTFVAPMPTARDSLAGATGSDGQIYAIGGFATGVGASNTVRLTTRTPTPGR